MDVESIKAVEPDIEVVVKSGQHEITVIGLFQNKSDVWDVVIGVDDVGRVDELRALFKTVDAALSSASFHAVRSTGG